MFLCFNALMINFWLRLKKPIMALAPMAGYTDSAFRLLCREFGADVVYMEMISSDALCFQNKKTLAMLNYAPEELPVVFQLFGSDPVKFKQAVEIINHQLSGVKCQPFGIDLNFGCPAPKVAKNGAGASLMNELDKSYQIIKTVCDTSRFPVSVKIRAQVKNTTALDFIQKIKDLPWTAVMIHGRSLKQGFAGDIDYQMIKKIKTLVPEKIVLANGGINNARDGQETLAATKTDGLGIARGALGNPWLFQEIKNRFETNPATDKNIPWSERKKTILKHAKLFLASNPDLIPLRKHLIHYFKGLKNASEMRQQIIKAETLADLRQILKHQE